jgi:hypothetical protein
MYNPKEKQRYIEPEFIVLKCQIQIIVILYSNKHLIENIKYRN